MIKHEIYLGSNSKQTFQADVLVNQIVKTIRLVKTSDGFKIIWHYKKNRLPERKETKKFCLIESEEKHPSKATRVAEFSSDRYKLFELIESATR